LTGANFDGKVEVVAPVLVKRAENFLGRRFAAAPDILKHKFQRLSSDL
jgi:hypothetical protein